MSSSRVFNGCRVLMAAAKATATKSSSTVAVKPKAAPSGAKPSSGIQKAYPVSPAMRQFLGVPEASRTEVVKKIWEHIKSNNLQNPANRREINCDAKLKSIFEGKDKVGMMEIAKLMSPHFIKTG